MTLAFVVGIVGYLVGMLHGRRLSTPRMVSGNGYARLANGPVSWGHYTLSLKPAHAQVIVNTQYNAHPPVS